MADEMNTTNGSTTFDPIANYARLSERVEGQGRDIVDLRSNMNTGFQNIQGAILSLTNELRGSTKTQWPVIWSAIGVSFAILVAVGSQAISPIRDSVDEQKVEMKSFRGDFMPRAELEALSARGKDERDRMWQVLAAALPRNEWQERNSSRDKEIFDIQRQFETTRGDQQRQIDEMKTAIGGIYGARDIILDLRGRIDRLEAALQQAQRTP